MLTRDDRSLTLPIRQGTKEGPTPSPPEVTAPHQCLCGLPGRDGRRGISARGDASSPYPRGSPPPRPGRPRAGRHRLRRRERPSRRPRRRRPPPPSRAAARRPAAGRGRPWRCCCPTAGSAFPTRSWGSPRTTRPRARAQSSPSWAGGVVGLGRVPTGPGVAFLSALGKPGHFSAADVIRRPLGDPCGRALRRLLFERGEMRLARHELPYGRHSPRHPVMGPVTLPCGRRLAPGEALAAERTTRPRKADTRPEAALGPPLLGRIQTVPRGFVWVAASAKTAS